MLNFEQGFTQVINYHGDDHDDDHGNTDVGDNHVNGDVGDDHGDGHGNCDVKLFLWQDHAVLAWLV